MAKGYYVYRQFNKRTGEYYLGKGTYSDRDPDGSKYQGSGLLLLRKMKAHPNEFEKEIIRVFENEDDAYAYEAELVGEKYIGGSDHDPLCLNMNSGGMGSSSNALKHYCSNPIVKMEMSKRGKELWEDESYRERVLASREGEPRQRWHDSHKKALKDPEVRARIKASANCPKKRAKLHSKNKPDTIAMVRTGVEVEIPRGELSDYFRLGWSLCSKGVVNIHREDIGIYSCGQHDVVKHLVLDHGFKFGTHFDLERVNYDVISKLSGVKEAKANGQVSSWSSKPVKLINLEGDVEEVCREDYINKLKEGYLFKSVNITLRNNLKKQTVFLGRGTAKRLLLASVDWELGSRRGYDSIKARDLDWSEIA
jgi:hypothetical protein